MSNQVKAWMENYKINLVNQIALLQHRVTLINAMLLEFKPDPVAAPAPAKVRPKPPTPVGESADKLIATALNSALGEPKKPRPPPKKSKVIPLIRMALDAAGERGVTARELIEVTQLPKGTATSRVSLMARDGVSGVRYDKQSHRYFAIHSEREDNNMS
jgi:hypothetical protein